MAYNQGGCLMADERANDFFIDRPELGVMRIGKSRVSLYSVLIELERGESPEAIQRSFPALSIEQVRGAIDYIRAHPAEVESYRAAIDAEWEQIRAEHEDGSDPLL